MFNHVYPNLDKSNQVKKSLNKKSLNKFEQEKFKQVLTSLNKFEHSFINHFILNSKQDSKPHEYNDVTF